MSKTNTRNNQHSLIVEIIAERRRLKLDSVRKVLDGARRNPDVMEDYVEISQTYNKLKKALVKLVPFTIIQTPNADN